MSTIIPEADLPTALTIDQAVEAAYAVELAEVASRVQRNLPTLIECEKEMVPYIFVNLRSRLRQADLRCEYIAGIPREGEAAGPVPMGLMGTMIAQIRNFVRGAVERRVLVLPHLDLLTTSTGGLTGEAREVIVLLYENPELVWVGFKDPSFQLPEVITNLFPYRTSLVGIGRDRLRHLVLKSEARKFGREFNPWSLYKYVSGLNAVRMRRLLASLEGEDYPADPKPAYRQLRQATLTGTMEIPDVNLDTEIGGYDKVKDRLHKEILDVLARRDRSTSEEEIRSLEELIPRGMIFWGPPGTGKTYFAKAIASAIGAAITVVSGPELKSKWVGESLPWEEPVLVVVDGEARKLPIGELVDNHRPGRDVRAWTVLDNGTATLAPVTGFIRHKGPDYIDVLVTETGREVRVTGGHSLFVDDNGTLGEVFAEQIEAGKTRIAVPLRLVPPETIRSLDLLELLSGRTDVHVQGYDDQLAALVGEVGSKTLTARGGVDVRRLTHKRRPPLSVAAFERMVSATDREPEMASLSLYRHHRGKSLPARIELTPELGEFLGLWVADGCYAETGVRIASNLEQVDRIEALCRGLFGHVTRSLKLASPQSVDLVINHTLLRDVMLDGLKMLDGSGRKRVPAFVFLATKPVIAGFLRGYFSGDGSFSGKYVEATTISRELADDVATLLQYFGIAARLRKKPERSGSTSYRVRFVWSKFLRTFADEIGFLDDRRQVKLRDYVDGMTFRRDLQTPQRHITNDVLWDLVVEKRREPYAREFVYDLSVPLTERFIAGYGNVLVHNSEENLRQIFHKARQSAPSIIVFDELDSFASARGTYTGSGVEHSMVNQLLTEMDGFHKEELVFVVGTTNFVESLDPALMRPGRFEFHLHIPYPDHDDRREILKIYNRKMRLQMTEEAIEFAVKRTDYPVPGAAENTRYSGDHIQALCRSIARARLRHGTANELTTPAEIESALTEWIDRPKITPSEEKILATHEAGHAVVGLFCPHYPPIERITIASDNPWAFGYVKASEPTNRYIQTINVLIDMICVSLGAREAEKLLLSEISLGAVGDLDNATSIARALVEVHGLGGEELGMVQYVNPRNGHRRDLAPETLLAIDRQVRSIVEEQRARAEKILRENIPLIELLRDMLLEHKTIDAKGLNEMTAGRNEGKKTPTAKKKKDNDGG